MTKAQLQTIFEFAKPTGDVVKVRVHLADGGYEDLNIDSVMCFSDVTLLVTKENS